MSCGSNGGDGGGAAEAEAAEAAGRGDDAVLAPRSKARYNSTRTNETPPSSSYWRSLASRSKLRLRLQLVGKKLAASSRMDRRRRRR